MKTLNIFALISIFVTLVNCNVIPESYSLVKEALKGLKLSNVEGIDVLLENTIVKRQISSDIVAACQLEQLDYSECFTDAEDNEATCKIVSSERCQKFYSNPASILPSCEKLDKSEREGLYALLKYIGSILNLFCAKNRTCQLAIEVYNKGMDKYNGSNVQTIEFSTQSESVIKNDCHYKECVDKSIAFYEAQIEVMESSTLSNAEKEKVKAEANKNLEQYRSPSCTELIGTSINTTTPAINTSNNTTTPEINTSNNTSTSSSDISSKVNPISDIKDDDKSNDTSKMNASNILLFTIITLTSLFLF